MAKKYCWKCDKNLDTSLYYKSKNRPDGLQGMCKKCYKLYRKQWLSKNQIKYKKSCKLWESKNKKQIYTTQKKWRNENREYFRKQQREYKAKKRKNDLVFKITANLRNRVRKAMKGICKSKHTMELLGCNIVEFQNHIEKQFKQGMNWNNYGKWELDHIKPCCSFNLLDIKQQKICFYYLNMQPLWKKEHRQKTINDIKVYDF